MLVEELTYLLDYQLTMTYMINNGLFFSQILRTCFQQKQAIFTISFISEKLLVQHNLTTCRLSFYTFQIMRRHTTYLINNTEHCEPEKSIWLNCEPEKSIWLNLGHYWSE